MKTWEVELLRAYTNNNKKCYVYGIVYSKTIIDSKTGLYDDHFIESQVKANEVFRNTMRDTDGWLSNQLCFMSIKPNLTNVTILNGKLKTK